MELRDIVRIVQDRWRSIVVVMLVVLAGTALATALMPKVYEAETLLFVSTPGGKDNEALRDGNTFTQLRVMSYVDVTSTRKVLDPVIETLKLNTTAEKLAKKIDATVPPGTVLLKVTATNPDPRVAAQIADAVGTQLTKTVAELESVAAASPVRVTVLTPPVVPTDPSSPKTARNASLGVVLGLLLGLGLALLRGSGSGSDTSSSKSSRASKSKEA